MAERVSRWWRSYHFLDDSDAMSPRTFHRVRLSQAPILPGFTLERIVGYHRAYFIPVTGDPNVSGAVLSVVNQACLVWDDGNDPAIATASMEQIMNIHYDKVLWTKTWTWSNLFGFDYIGGLAPGVLDDHPSGNFDVHGRRAVPVSSANNGYLWFFAQGYGAIGHDLPRDFLNHLGLNVLVSTLL